MESMPVKKISFEQAFNRLEEIVRLLEKGDLALDDSLRLFEEGIELARVCSAKLDEAQGRVEVLVKLKEGEPVTTDFLAAEEGSAG